MVREVRMMPGRAGSVCPARPLPPALQWGDLPLTRTPYPMPERDAQHSHLDRLERAYAEALARHGFDGVLLYSGRPARHHGDDQYASFAAYGHFVHWTGQVRSEERRVGKEWRSRWGTDR